MLIVEQKNQTAPDVVAAFSRLSSGEERIGFGIFIVADPTQPLDGMRKVVVPDLDYDDCVRRGYDCVAFKWLPATEENTRAIKELRACDPFPCTNSCLNQCVCVNGRCR